MRRSSRQMNSPGSFWFTVESSNPSANMDLHMSAMMYCYVIISEVWHFRQVVRTNQQSSNIRTGILFWTQKASLFCVKTRLIRSRGRVAESSYSSETTKENLTTLCCRPSIWKRRATSWTSSGWPMTLTTWSLEDYPVFANIVEKTWKGEFLGFFGCLFSDHNGFHEER